MIKIDTRVKYIASDSDGLYYPPMGTLGTVVCVDNARTCAVKWDSGVKNDSYWGENTWWCNITDVEEMASC